MVVAPAQKDGPQTGASRAANKTEEAMRHPRRSLLSCAYGLAVEHFAYTDELLLEQHQLNTLPAYSAWKSFYKKLKR